eukprot:1382780-Prorocentrum_lima.AAC.1
MARHWFVEAFDNIERGGGNPRAIVTDGTSLYQSLDRVNNDPSPFPNDADEYNVDIMADYAARW